MRQFGPHCVYIKFTKEKGKIHRVLPCLAVPGLVLDRVLRRVPPCLAPCVRPCPCIAVFVLSGRALRSPSCLSVHCGPRPVCPCIAVHCGPRPVWPCIAVTVLSGRALWSPSCLAVHCRALRSPSCLAVHCGPRPVWPCIAVHCGHRPVWPCIAGPVLWWTLRPVCDPLCCWAPWGCWVTSSYL